MSTDAYAARLALIHERQTDAQVLLIRAKHDAMKTHVSNAIEELTDAERLLTNPSHTMAPDMVLRWVDVTIESATLWLTMVEQALSDHGPDADQL